ncbi:DUF3576 domain-containing protein [Elioraea thermophila]|uniref:DUF3576 domain-containing protein n=1 Tax=Elioraea thermophila TaxID=2185104 RepID=UPI000DF494C1|nr:DUF3576 domain-containing protein [Elioraea thermophila]
MRRVWLALFAVLALTACGQGRYVEESEYNDDFNRGPERGSIAGRDGLIVFGTDRSRRDEGGGALGVNAFLWRGTLDTLSFMPLVSADPFGGVIITDWYSPPEAPNERFKVTAYILGRQLRADGIRVSVFRQVNSRGQWIDVPVTADMAPQLEDKILARARELRVQSQLAGR